MNEYFDKIENEDCRAKFESWTGGNVEILYVNEGMSETIVVYLGRGRLRIARLFELPNGWQISIDFEETTESIHARFAVAREPGRF